MIAAFAVSLNPWVYPFLAVVFGGFGGLRLEPESLLLLVVPTLFGMLAGYSVLSALKRRRIA